jgi:glycyl-tRNA synthetase
MIRLREFTQAEAEIFVHPDEKDHPRFARYAEYEVPLFGQKQQQENSVPVVLTMRQAVNEGIIANEYVAYYVALTHQLLVRIGVKPDRLRFRQHLPDELAHYAEDCWDAEILSERFGWVETVGIADRTDYDLRAHEKQSGQSFTVFIQYETPKRVKRRRVVADMGALGPKYRGKAKDIADALATTEPGPDGITVTVGSEQFFVPKNLYKVIEEEIDLQGEEVRPHVIEPSYGIDRMCYAVLEQSYDEDVVDGEERRVLRLSPLVAPVQVAVFPLMNRDGLDLIADQLTHRLHEHHILAEYDDSGAIGRRYRRQDEIGTPFCVTIDYDTKENQTVTIRDRDTMTQVRVPIDRVPDMISDLIEGRGSFSAICP